MATIFDYLDWRGDISFSELGLNEVDSLILSAISYIDFKDIISDTHDGRQIQFLTAARQYLRVHKGESAYVGAIIPPTIVTLLAKAAKTKRFGNIRITGYVNHVDTASQVQFSAMTFLLGNGTSFLAYRGTDDTLVGWKENFNMSFMNPVPAQIEAVKYLGRAASVIEGDLFLGGHSKGGNLAVYASVKCDDAIKKRIVRTYNHDGPGFTAEFIAGEDYLSIRDRISTFVPESSVVGMLLEHEETHQVVKSSQTGLLQHDPSSWEILGGKFIYLDSVSDESRKIDETVKRWLREMDAKQREEFVDAVYETLISTNATTLTDINTDKFKLIKAWGALNEESKSVVIKSIKLLFKGGIKNLNIKKTK